MEKSTTAGISILGESNFIRNHTRLRLVQSEDIEQIRVWRNEQIQVLRQESAITVDEQIRYYSEHVFPEFAKITPKLLLFSIFYNDEFVGYGGLVHLAWENRRGEVSFLLNPLISENDPDGLYRTIFLDFLNLIELISFRELGLHKVTTETFAFRKTHITILEEAGMKREGILKDQVRIDGSFHDSILHRILESDYSNEY